MTADDTDLAVDVAGQAATAIGSPSVAVIIPSKDRPDFLQEAIASAINQTHAPREILVVDDGSTVPVDAVRLRERHGPTVRVMRNEQSRGLAYSRNRGVEEASAEYVIHLDDDDRLGPDAIEQCLRVLSSHPEVELVMFAVEGFGPHADYFNRVQTAGVNRVIDLGKGTSAEENVFLFDQDLFEALLKTVPSAFQRVMTSKTTWTRISELRWRVYRLDPAVADDDEAKLVITGFLRDSEWARYAAALCKQTALINRPLYFARCARQGYSSQPSNRAAHGRQALEILEQLLLGAEKLPELVKWQSQVRDALAQGYFDAAYWLYHSGERMRAWYCLRKSMAKDIKLKHFRLVVRLTLPYCRSE